MRTDIQRELDRAEEEILTKLFGDISSPRISPKLQMAMQIKGISFDEFINEKIQIFESFMSDFMLDDGYIDTQKAKVFLINKYPALEGLNIPPMRPIDLVNLINAFIPLEQLGTMIENFWGERWHTMTK